MTAGTGPAGPDLLGQLLRDVSRSFYTTLAILPAPVRKQIGLAYLLARASDTIADTELVPVSDRLAALDRLRACIAGTAGAALPDLAQLQPHQGVPAEKTLLERLPEALALLGSVDDWDRARIREVLDIIVLGQRLDLERFATASSQDIRALATAADLDDYTYRVAGCVGVFWTTLCRRHVFPSARLDERLLVENGLRFGKGLQLVNILRDLPRDLRTGRCYLPLDELRALSLTPAALLDMAHESRLRPLYNRWAGVARDHLVAGWTYTNTLPHRHVRLKLACAWPVLIGMRTLKLLRVGRILDPEQRIRVPRTEIRSILLRSMVLYPFRDTWRRQLDPLGG